MSGGAEKQNPFMLSPDTFRLVCHALFTAGLMYSCKDSVHLLFLLIFWRKPLTPMVES